MCGLVFGIAGGVTGSVVGADVGRDVGESINTLRNMTPQGLVEGSIQMFGTDEERRQYYEDQEFLRQAGL